MDGLKEHEVIRAKVGDEVKLPGEGWCLIANIFPTTILLYRIYDTNPKGRTRIIANRQFLQEAETNERPPEKVRFNRFDFTMGDDCFYLSHGEYPSVCRAVAKPGVYLGSNRDAVVSLVDIERPLEEIRISCRDVWTYL